MAKILCICLSSTIQRTINFKNIKLEHVNRSTNYRMDASGKALNSARVLSQLEKDCVQVVCPLGEKNSSLFLELAKKDELNLEYVTVPGFTRECWTLLDNSVGTTTEVVVGEPEIDFDVEFLEAELKNLISKKLDFCDAVLFAGSRPRCYSKNLVAQIAGLAVSKNKVFLADYHGDDLLQTLKVCVPHIIKINEEEFSQTFGLKEDFTSEDLKDAIIKKSRELNNIIVVTRGSKNTYACDKGVFAECPIEKVKAVNTTACGDSFSAGFIYEYMSSCDFEKALKKGTWCASRNAELETPGAIR